MDAIKRVKSSKIFEVKLLFDLKVIYHLKNIIQVIALLFLNEEIYHI